MPYNLYVFALNIRVAQLFDGIIMIGSASHLIEQRSCGSGEGIDAIKTQLRVVVLIVLFRVGGEASF